MMYTITEINIIFEQLICRNQSLGKFAEHMISGWQVADSKHKKLFHKPMDKMIRDNNYM
jgi:hypothetical protein